MVQESASFRSIGFPMCTMARSSLDRTTCTTMMYGCVPNIDPIGVLPSADGITVILVFAHFSGAHKGNNCFLRIIYIYGLQDLQVWECPFPSVRERPFPISVEPWTMRGGIEQFGLGKSRSTSAASSPARSSVASTPISSTYQAGAYAGRIPRVHK